MYTTCRLFSNSAHTQFFARLFPVYSMLGISYIPYVPTVGKVGKVGK